MRMTLGRFMVAFGAICIGLVFLYAYRMSQIEADLVAARAKLETTILGLETTRPVLHGDPIAGRAFDHYDLIAGLLAPNFERERSDYLAARREGDAGATKLRNRLLDKNRAALVKLRLGARCADASYAVDWGNLSPPKLSALMNPRAIADLSILAAERHLDEKEPELATDVLLDCLQLSRDKTTTPIIISELAGLALLNITTEALLDEHLVARFPKEELGRLARGLRIADESLPEISYSQEGELLYLANLVLDPDQPGYVLPTDLDLGLWAYGFSAKALYADHIMNSMDDIQALHELDDEPWAVRKAELARQLALAESSHNFLSQKPSNNQLRYETARREAIARLRLARALIEFKLTGEVPTIPDPFGGNLRVSTIGEKVRIESTHAAAAEEPEKFRVETE